MHYVAAGVHQPCFCHEGIVNDGHSVKLQNEFWVCIDGSVHHVWNNWKLLLDVGTSASILQKKIAAEVAKRISQLWVPVFLRKKVTILQMVLVCYLIIATYVH